MCSIKIYIRLKRLSFACFSSEAKQSVKVTNGNITTISIYFSLFYVCEHFLLLAALVIASPLLCAICWQTIDNKRGLSKNKSKHSIAKSEHHHHPNMYADQSWHWWYTQRIEISFEQNHRAIIGNNEINKIQLC